MKIYFLGDENRRGDCMGIRVLLREGDRLWMERRGLWGVGAMVIRCGSLKNDKFDDV